MRKIPERNVTREDPTLLGKAGGQARLPSGNGVIAEKLSMAGQNNISTKSHWMPFTANRQFHKDPRVIVEANGCRFLSQDGREVFDSLSGLWCSGYGHNRKEINEAVTKQLETLDFAPSFQFTHPGATELADR